MQSARHQHHATADRPLTARESMRSSHALVQASIGTQADAPCHRKRCGFSWKNPRETGLMPDRPVPGYPFFSTPGGTTMSTYDGTVDTPQFLIHLSGLDDVGLQTMQNPIPQSLRRPLIESAIDRLPRAKYFRQIPPLSPGVLDPKDRIDHQSIICWWTPGVRWRRKQIGNQFPLFICESMSRHNAALHGVRNRVRPNLSETARGLK